MTNLFEISIKIPPIVEVAIDVYARNHILHTARYTFEQMQLAHYWLKEAEADLQQELEAGDDIPREFTNIKAPTLIGAVDQMNYIKEKLEELSKGVFSYSESGLPPKVQYKIQQAYNKITDAKYYNELSIQYHGQLTDARAGRG